MIKALKKLLIKFKEDLKIADTCKAVRDNLIQTLTNDAYFSPAFCTYFSPLHTNYFPILETDPTQVSAIKKILNALQHVQAGIRGLENINLHQSRYNAAITKDAGAATYQLIHELYTALHLVDECSVDVQALVMPYFNQLLPKIRHASALIAQLQPGKPLLHHFSDGVSAINPANPHTDPLSSLSRAFFNAPRHFEQLHQLINPNTDGINVPSLFPSKHPEEMGVVDRQVAKLAFETYQATLKTKALKLKETLNNTLQSSGGTLWINYASTLYQLITNTMDIITTATPLMNTAYGETLKKLNEIRHEHLPQLVSELETIEEKMGFKTGLLTKPALTQIHAFYEQLILQVSNAHDKAQILGKKADYARLFSSSSFSSRHVDLLSSNTKSIDDVKHLLDDTFQSTIRLNQQRRLAEATIDAENITPIHEADAFFNLLTTYNTPLAGLRYRYNLANINPDDKATLIKHYKHIQYYVAKRHPDIDTIIVNALNPSQSTDLLNQFTMAFKQIWSQNHFASIMACQPSIRCDILQVKAQATFRQQMIHATIVHSDTLIYSLNKSHTEFNEIEAEVTSLDIELLDGQQSDYYHSKRLLAYTQQEHFRITENALHAFYTHCKALTLTRETSIGNLTDTDKEPLRQSFKLVGSYVKTTIGINAYKKIIQALTTSAPSSTDLMYSELLGMQRVLINAINHDKTQVTLMSNRIQAKKSAALNHEHTLAPLVTRGEEFGKQSMLASVKKLKLSLKVKHFLIHTIQPYLENNLSPVLLAYLLQGKPYLDFSVLDLPFASLHEDIHEIRMYKELMNAVHYFSECLLKIENLDDYKGSHSFFYRAQSTYLLERAVDSDLNYATYYLSEANNNPCLKSLVADFVEQLKPLKAIPYMASLFEKVQPTQPIRNSSDIIQQWYMQQNIVAKHTGKTARVVDVLEDRVIKTDDVEDEYKLDLTFSTKEKAQALLDDLFILPAKIRALHAPHSADIQADILKAQHNAKQLLQQFEGINYGPESLKTILLAFKTVSDAIKDVGTASHEAVYKQLDGLRGAMALGLSAIDNTEFQLGLKPGTLSTIAADTLTSFYKTFIEQLPFTDPQDKLHHLCSQDVIQARIAQEQQRLIASKQPHESIETISTQLFGANHPDHDHINALFEQMGAIVKKGIVVSDQAELESIYAALYPYLQNIPLYDNDESAQHYITASLFPFGGSFPANYINALDAKAPNYLEQLEEVIENTLSVQPLTNYHDGIFQKIKALLDEETNDEPGFSTEYNKEQFLRYYETLQPYLIKIHHKFLPRSFLRMLQEQTDFNDAAHDILQLKPELESVLWTIDQSRIASINRCEEKIAYLNQQASLAEKNRIQRIETYKTSCFEQSFMEKLQSNLGPYATIFSQTLSAEINDNFRDETLRDIGLDHPIQEMITNAIAQKMDEFNLTNNAFYNAFATLNEQFKQVTQMLLDAQSKIDCFHDNPCRLEKIDLLTSIKSALINLDNYNANKTVEEILSSTPVVPHQHLRDYDYIVAAYESLNTMLGYVGQQKNSELKQSKIDAILQLRVELSSTSEPLHVRKQRALNCLSAGSEKLLLQEEPPHGFFARLLQLVKKFLNWIGVKSNELIRSETAVSGLKQQLNEIKDHSSYGNIWSKISHKRNNPLIQHPEDNNHLDDVNNDIVPVEEVPNSNGLSLIP